MFVASLVKGVIVGAAGGEVSIQFNGLAPLKLPGMLAAFPARSAMLPPSTLRSAVVSMVMAPLSLATTV